MTHNLGLAKTLHVGISGWGAGGWGRREQGHPRVEPVVGEKWCKSGGRMLGVIVAEFCHGKEAGPVGLLVVAVHAQVLLQHRVEPLRLAIRLRVERRGPVGSNSTELEQPRPEVGGEDGIPIADQGFRQAVNPDHVLQEQSSHVRS